MTSCSNCQTEFEGKYCPACGQKDLDRLTLRYVADNTAGTILSYDNSFFHTLKALALKPGEVLTEFMDGKRAHYFEPFRFLLLTTTLSSLVFILLPKGTSTFNFTVDGSVEAEELTRHVFERYYSLLLFATIPTGGLINSWFFRKVKFNLAEHFVVLTYVTGMSNLFNIPILLLSAPKITALSIGGGVLGLIMYLYVFWYYIAVYKEKVIWGILKTIAASIINMSIFLVLTVGILVVYFKLLK